MRCTLWSCMLRKFWKKERQPIRTIPESDVEVPFICQLPPEIQQRILDEIGHDELPTMFELARACRSTWQMVERARKDEAPVELLVNKNGEVGLRLLLNVAREDRRKGMMLMSPETAKLLFARRHVERIRIEAVDPERVLSLLVGMTASNVVARFMKLEWAQKLKPKDQNFFKMTFRRSERTPRFFEFCENYVDVLTIDSPRCLRDCLAFRHPVLSIRVDVRQKPEVMRFLRAIAKEWQRGLRDVRRIEVTTFYRWVVVSKAGLRAEDAGLALTSRHGSNFERYKKMS
ncbi:unnamed protein product, partial [Mesorhabditis spiculigera]